MIRKICIITAISIFTVVVNWLCACQENPQNWERKYMVVVNSGTELYPKIDTIYTHGINYNKNEYGDLEIYQGNDGLYKILETYSNVVYIKVIN